MAAVISASVGSLTYEAYLAEPHVEGRYDIVEGTRLFMSGATWEHQAVSGNLYDLLRRYARASGAGTALYAPFDVMIRRAPRLQTRQPDLLFVSNARLAQGGGVPAVGPLVVAPELVIEIISTSETQRILGDKVADYATIGVEECWVIRMETQTIELLQPGQSGSQIIAVVGQTQSLMSLIFSDLSVTVTDVFQA